MLRRLEILNFVGVGLFDGILAGRAGVIVIAGLFAMIGFSGAVRAQVQGGLGKTVDYGSWTLTCVRQDGQSAVQQPVTAEPTPSGKEQKERQPGSSCTFSQRLSAKDTREIVFAFSVLPATKKRQYAAILSVPLGGYLAPGMELKVDQGKPFKVLFETCNVGGCHGGFELAGRILKEMQTGKTMNVRLWTAKSTPVDVRIDLNGFGPGFAALKERS